MQPQKRRNINDLALHMLWVSEHSTEPSAAKRNSVLAIGSETRKETKVQEK